MGIEYGTVISYSFGAALAAFYAQIDEMVAHGARWCRIGPSEFILDERFCTATSLTWDVTGWQAATDAAIDYAYGKGLKIDYLMAVPISFTGTFSQSDYLNVVDLYCAHLAERYAGKIALWSVDNEGNMGDYRGLGRDTTTLAYRTELAGMLTRARTAIRLHDTAPVGHDVASSVNGYLDATAYTALTTFLDTIMPATDAIVLHNYTQVISAGLLNDLPGYLTGLQTRYGKPLYITEMGMFSFVAGQPTYTEQYQADSITAMLRAMQAATPQPVAIIAYRLREPPSGIASVTIVDPGLYLSPPTIVAFSGGTNAGSPGGGTGTVQTVYNGATGYIITGVTVTAAGLYDAPPHVGFDGTPGSGHLGSAVANLGGEHLGLENPDGSHKLGFAAFFVGLLPTIATIAPASASTLGGTPIGIAGANFVIGATTVSFDGIPSPLVVVASTTLLTCVVPAHAATAFSAVSVATAGGTATRSDLFSFVPPPPIAGDVGAVTRATGRLIGMADTGDGTLLAHLYAPAPLGTPDSARVHLATVATAGATVRMTQANRFDGHQIVLAEDDRDAAAALTMRAQVDLEEPGLGIVARGLVVNPVQAVTPSGDGTTTVDLDNLTAELAMTNLGLRYVDGQEIGQIVRNLGAATTAGESVFLGRDATGRAITSQVPGLPTGWKADYLDDGSHELSAAPVQWGPTAADNLGGAIVGLVANGNSVSRQAASDFLSPPIFVAGNAAATGLPGHDDAQRAMALSYQVVVPTTAYAGVQRFTAVGGGVAFGFAHTAVAQAGGAWQYQVQVIDDGLFVGGLIVAANTRFKVQLESAPSPHFSYWVQRPTDAAWVLVLVGAAAARLPAFPACVIFNQGGEIANAVMTHDVPMSRVGWQVRDDGASNLGGLLNLAADTGLFLRQALDPVTATPLRAMEFGPLGEWSGVTLVDAGAADLARLLANPRKRVVTAVTAYSRIDNVVTVLTALGGGTYPAQLDMERAWLILNDPSYANYGLRFFPEYDLDYTLHRVAAIGGGYEYYIRYQPAFLPGGIGEIRGEPYVNQALGFPPDGATAAEQELAARTLYAAAVAQMRAGMRPRVTFTATLVGVGRPPRAGSKVAVDYTHRAADRDGPYVPLRITTSPADDGRWRVLAATRTYGAGMPEDTYVLSSSGKYGDAVEAATGAQRQQLALQIGSNAVSNVSMEAGALESLDALNPIVRNYYIDPSCIRLTKARFKVEFAAYLQPVKTSRNPTGTPVVAVGNLAIDLPTPNAISATSAPIGGVPPHQHDIPFIQSGSTGEDVTGAHWLGVVGPGDTEITAAGAAGRVRTTGAVEDPSTAGTDHSHPVAAAGSTIAHIPGGTVLATLPPHVHDIDPELNALSAPTQISVWIDSGDGIFVDRSPEVGDGTTSGPWTGDFVFEAARFMDFPGRDVRVKFVSTDNTNHGRGALRISRTIVGLYVGTDEIVSQLA